MKRRPTLKDVASACGLHHSTISRALRENPSIPEATRNRVKQVATKLGYQADPFLSALVNRKHMQRVGSGLANLVWLTNFDTKDGWKATTHNMGFFNGCFERAQENGCNLDVIWAGDRSDASVEQLLAARGVRGVIHAPTPHGRENVKITIADIHCVALGLSYKSDDVIQICHDHYHSVGTLVQKLALEGFRKPIFYASRETDLNVDYLMSHGFSYGVVSSGLNVSRLPSYVPWGITSSELAKRIIDDRPDVAIIHYRNWANLESAFHKLNYRVPEDLSLAVVTLPDEDYDIGGVKENAHQMGRIAVDMLIDLIIRGRIENKTKPRRLLIDGTVVKGRTIGVPPSNSIPN